MTPREKAEELYWKYAEILYLLHDVRLLKNSYAKQSALIAADEIIEFMEADDFDSDTCYWANHSKMKYWVEVKQEIENL